MRPDCPNCRWVMENTRWTSCQPCADTILKASQRCEAKPFGNADMNSKDLGPSPIAGCDASSTQEAHPMERMRDAAKSSVGAVIPYQGLPLILGSGLSAGLSDPSNPATNPKEAAGAKKPSTWSVMPRWVMLLVGRVMQVGAAKYGAFNYRETPITASTYEDAMERHAGLWFDGEDNDPETGVSHLASVIAGCALLMDAQATGKLVDNRQKTGLVRARLDALSGLLLTLPLPQRHVPA